LYNFQFHWMDSWYCSMSLACRLKKLTFQFHWMDSNFDSNEADVVEIYTFNSIEWIPRNTTWDSSNRRFGFAFNSIEWIHRLIGAPRTTFLSKLSIPLNGFGKSSTRPSELALPLTFNSIEWIHVRITLEERYKLLRYLFQFHWMDS